MKIAVLAGGISTERDVSLISGRKIFEACRANGHKTVFLDVYLGLPGVKAEGIFELDTDWFAGIRDIQETITDIESIKALRQDDKKDFFGPGVLDICREADLVFMALHGENGENGKIQAAFDLHGIRYTGTDYISSAMAMDKAVAKELFAYYGVPTPEGVRLKRGENTGDGIAFPKVVKVTDGGSSVGVSIVREESEYEEALRDAFSYGDEVIVERYIKGREFSCGVIDGRALPVIEIAPVSGFYDYKNKYQPGATVETCPAELSEEKTREIQRVSEAAFACLRLKTYARMDIMMDDKTGDIFCLEANTLPGMTPMSLLPQEAAAVGMDFNTLCEEIIRVSLEKYN